MHPASPFRELSPSHTPQSPCFCLLHSPPQLKNFLKRTFRKSGSSYFSLGGNSMWQRWTGWPSTWKGNALTLSLQALGDRQPWNWPFRQQVGWVVRFNEKLHYLTCCFHLPWHKPWPPSSPKVTGWCYLPQEVRGESSFSLEVFRDRWLLGRDCGEKTEDWGWWLGRVISKTPQLLWFGAPPD